MKVNNYPVKTPEAGDRLFGSDVSGDQVQFDMTAVSSNVFQYQIGEYVADEGGIIFHRYIDNNVQYYLVIDTTDLSASSVWSNITSTAIGSAAVSSWNGLSNSNAIVGQSGFTSGGAKLCLDSTNNSKSDWYLPSIDELVLLFNNRFNINRTLFGASSYGVIVGSSIIDFNGYWSSMENSSTSAFYLDFEAGVPGISLKGDSNHIRAVRQFSI